MRVNLRFQPLPGLYRHVLVRPERAALPAAEKVFDECEWLRIEALHANLVAEIGEGIDHLLRR